MTEQISKTKNDSSFWKIVIPYIILGMGVVLVTGGGSWDISNQLNKPESFFAEPHLILYRWGSAKNDSGLFSI